MKNLKTTLFLSAISLFTILFFSFKAEKTSHLIDDDLDVPPRSGGVAAILGQDRTGSPLSSSNCGGCHSGGSGTTTVSIGLKNSAGTSVTQYMADSVYTLELTVSGTSGNRRAVQGVVLTSTNAQAGTLSGATGISALSTAGGRQYLEHSSPATSTTSRTFSATWTAPSAGTGTVTVYSAGLAANNNSGTSGDTPSSSTSLSFTELRTDVFTIDTIVACDTYTWTNGTTYTSSNNTDKDTINLTGYDSIATLDLTINSSTTATDVQTACGSYRWIDGVTYTASNSTAKDTLVNAAGCDSVVTLNLTLTFIDTSLTISGANILTTPTGATYQWLDCNNSLAPISGETSAVFAPSASGSYAVEFTKGSCIDTSRCISFMLSSITKNQTSNIIVSPNPFNDFLFIQGADLNKATIQLYDISGKEYSNSIIINKNRINTIELPKGVYLLNIDGKVSKLVKL